MDDMTYLHLAPAQVAVRYERTYINNDVQARNVYKGPPRPELDDAWHDLFQCMCCKDSLD